MISERKNFGAFLFNIFQVFYYKINQAFDEQTKFSPAFDFTLLRYSQKFDACKK